MGRSLLSDGDRDLERRMVAVPHRREALPKAAGACK
jgi:hypothetical protein